MDHSSIVVDMLSQPIDVSLRVSNFLEGEAFLKNCYHNLSMLNEVWRQSIDLKRIEAEMGFLLANTGHRTCILDSAKGLYINHT